MKVTRKTLIIAVLAVTACAGTAATLVWRHNTKPDFSRMTPEQRRQFFDPNRMRNLSEEQRRQIGEAMRDRMTKEVKGYFALPEKERTAYLDKQIDEMQARRAEFRTAMARFDANTADANSRPRFRPRDANSPPQQFRRPEPERMRARSDFVSAETRSQMIKYRQDLRRRMQQRGITSMGPGGPRGGPGRGFGGRSRDN